MKKIEIWRNASLVMVLAMMSLLVACGGNQQNRQEDDERVASGLFEFTPNNQAATFRHVDELGFTRVIARGKQVSPLPSAAMNLNAMKYEFGGRSNSIDDYMQRSRTGGILILKNGAIVLERYGMGNTAKSKWTSFSAAKSITSTLVGAALKDGAIKSLDDPITDYLPQLKGSAYANNTVRQLLRMSSGVQWDETYSLEAESDISRLSQAAKSTTPGAVMELMRSRPRAAPAGSVFNYSTGESYLLGAVVAAATGQTLSDYLSKKIWAPAGMEADAYWLLDAKNGLEMGGNNLSATLRDYARFGLFFLHQGKIGDQSVLPQGWRDLAAHPDTALTAHGQLYPNYPLGYGYQWWSFPSGEYALPMHDNAFTAEGIFGQFIYINPTENVVVVIWSAWPQAWDSALEEETYTLIANAVANLSGT